MSIQSEQKIKELERRIEALEAMIKQPIQPEQERRKPGRPKVSQ